MSPAPGKPPSELTVEHGVRERVEMRWPVGVISRVDAAARELSVVEGRAITRTEWTLRQVMAGLGEVSGPAPARVRDPIRTARDEAVAAARDEQVEARSAEQAACVHPKDAWSRLGYLTRCGICGKRMDR